MKQLASWALGTFLISASLALLFLTVTTKAGGGEILAATVVGVAACVAAERLMK